MHLAYYLTSHGLGHAVRACAVCGHLPPSVDITFRTAVPESFFGVELDRPFAVSPAEFDCGCLQSDSVTVDVDATVAAYTRIAEANRTHLESEARWLTEHTVDVVAGDIPPFPFEAARVAGVPSAAIANFTWHEVYREYTDTHPAFAPVVSTMREQYAMAGVLLEAAPSLSMPYMTTRTSVGVVGRPGEDIREEIHSTLGIPRDRRLALLYLGSFGMAMPWQRLSAFDDWAFLSGDPLEGAPENVYRFDRRRLRYQHVAASVDAVVAKLGYGTCTSAMLNGVPIVYLPRERFAEYAALERGVRAWGGGVPITDEQFRTLDWADALESVARLGKPPTVADTGARACADALVSLGRGD